MESASARRVTIPLALLVFALSLPGKEASAEIRFGVIPRLPATELTTMFTPLVDYLTKETGEKVVLVIPKDFVSFVAAVKAGQIDVGHPNPLMYVQMKKAMPTIVPLALTAEPKGGTKFRGIFVARKDSGIEKIQDLKGKRLSFVHKNSAAAYIFQMLQMNKAGMDVEKDFITLPFAMKQDNVVMAVFNKTADAGGIREGDLDKMKDKVDLSQIKIVAYTEYFPNFPVFAGPHFDKKMAAKVKEALLKLKPNDPLSAKILGPAQIAGFAETSDKDFDTMRQAATLVGAL